MTFLLLSSTSLHFTLSSVFIFGIILFLVVGWMIFTVVIRYHWKNYGSGDIEILRMNVMYLVGSGVIFTLMIASAFLYFASSTL